VLYILVGSLVLGGIAWWTTGLMIAGIVVALVVFSLVVRTIGAPGDQAVYELEQRRGLIAPPGADSQSRD
jgi:hypothetical protein